MSDLSKLKEVLSNQRKKEINSGDYKQLAYRIDKDDECISLEIDSVEIGFVFTLRGRLVGIYNWKE